jgi:flagellar biosynthesis protein FlhG
VGKTNTSCNLGIQFAKAGYRVLLFDADLGLANIDVVLGVRAEFTLQHVLSGEKTLRQIVQEGPGGVQFIAGGSGVEAMVNLSGPQLDRFLTELAELERQTDILIFDTGAGIDGTVMTFLQAADETLLIATPDPASITDAYATAKALWARRPDATIRVILNMVSDDAQAKAVFAKLRSIAEQFLNRTLLYGGHIRQDNRALEWIRKRKPYSYADPKLPPSQDVAAIAASLLGQDFQKQEMSLGEKLRYMLGLNMRRTA